VFVSVKLVRKVALVNVCRDCQTERSAEDCTVNSSPGLPLSWNWKLPLARRTGVPMNRGAVFVSIMLTTDESWLPNHAPPEAEMSSRENCRLDR
jgi:hypothetical protein